MRVGCTETETHEVHSLGVRNFEVCWFSPIHVFPGCFVTVALTVEG